MLELGGNASELYIVALLILYQVLAHLILLMHTLPYLFLKTLVFISDVHSGGAYPLLGAVIFQL